MDPTSEIETRCAELSERQPTRREIEEQIDRFAEHLGLPGLPFDEDGIAFVEVDEELDIALFDSGGPGIILIAEIGSAENVSTDVLIHLLQANADWGLTEGGNLGIDPEGSRLLLSRQLLLVGSTPEQLESELAGFAEAVRTWRVELLSYIEDYEEVSVQTSSARAEALVRV